MIIFSYSGPSGILLGSDGKQNTVKARGRGGGGVRIVALSIILRNRLNKTEFAVF